MARHPKSIVFDSWAILAFLEDEGPGQRVAQMIADAHERGTPLRMTTVNVGEVWYILAREVSEDDADQAVASLRRLGIEFVDIDWKLARLAAGFKAKHRMSYADCFAAALAKETKADLVTGDTEFKQLDDQIKITWL